MYQQHLECMYENDLTHQKKPVCQKRFYLWSALHNSPTCRMWADGLLARSQSVAVNIIMHLFFSLASRYKDIPDGRSSNSLQYKNRKAGALWTPQGATESNSSPSRAKGHGQTRQTATKKSPLDRSRFISTAEKVITFEWFLICIRIWSHPLSQSESRIPMLYIP